ncbi:MAG TPA: glycosyltransferase family 4 protein, partial [Puia sp.]|nr:glycosyltransferase family 4 protein [Puia sp.]
ARSSLFKNRGGDTIQLHKTAESLGKLGVVVDVRLADEDIDYRCYDLIHFFNLMRPADILRHATTSGKPYVVSPLFVDYSEADRKTRKGLAKLLLRVVPPDRVEYLKVIARRLLNRERIVSPGYWWYGQRRSVHRILRHSSMLLPNSENEYLRLRQRFKIDFPYRVIPNAIDPGLFSLSDPDTGREKDLVLCVARIEGIKNQLNLIRAVNGSSLRLILIGAAAVNQRSYYKECRETAGPAVTFVEAVPHEKLAAYYRRAQVHALPSWFETTGLSSLEAAVMGCTIVITDKGDTKEYFGDQAVYCDPNSPASIRYALEKAVRDGPSATLREKILAKFCWQHTARATHEVYRAILGFD